MSHTIYIIKSPNTPKVYIGSTTIELKKCLSRHKSVRGCYSYDVITEGNPSIEELEKVDSSCVKQSLINWNIKFIETTVNKVYNQKLKKSEIKKLEFKKKKDTPKPSLKKEENKDTFSGWFKDRIVPGTRLYRSAAYKDYITYCCNIGSKPLSKKEILQQLVKECGSESKYSGDMIYRGFELKPVDNHHSNEDIKVQPK
jgi:hypothetical protein